MSVKERLSALHHSKMHYLLSKMDTVADAHDRPRFSKGLYIWFYIVKYSRALKFENVCQADGGVAGGAGVAVARQGNARAQNQPGLFHLHTRSLLLTYQVSFTYCSRASRERARSKSTRQGF